MNTHALDIMTTKEAAKFLGVSRHTLKFWRLHGKGPFFVKYAHAVRYRVSDLEVFRDARAVDLGGRVMATKDAAKFLGMSRHTLKFWRVQGKGPLYHKFGRAVFYRVSDLEAFRDARVVPQWVKTE